MEWEKSYPQSSLTALIVSCTIVLVQYKLIMQNKTKIYQKQLLEAILSNKNKKELETFLSDLLTPQEFNELAVRWQIVRELAKGTSQRIVARKFGVGIATVTRGAKALNDSRGGFNRLLKLLRK